MFLTHYNPADRLLRQLTDFAPEINKSLVPPVDIEEKDNEWLFSVDLPGVDSKDIEIEVKGENLIVSATRKNSVTEKKDNYVYTERSNGEYKRWFTLPDNADSEQVSATTRDGVLAIKVAKRNQAQPRKISVESSAPSEK